MGERPTTHGYGSPGIGGIVIVPNGKLIVVLVPGLVLVLVGVSVVVVSVPVVVVVVVVEVVVSVVVVVVVGDVVVVLAGVRDVVDTGVNGLLSLELDPPKTNRMISTTMIAARAPNRISAHGLRYQGTGGGPSGGPGGGPGGCWPYAPYAGGCLE